MDEKLKRAMSIIGGVWYVASPRRKWLVRRLWPRLAAGLDLLDHWIRERGPL